MGKVIILITVVYSNASHFDQYIQLYCTDLINSFSNMDPVYQHLPQTTGKQIQNLKRPKIPLPKVPVQELPFQSQIPPFIMKSSAEPNHKIFPVQCNGAVFHFRPTFVLNRAAFHFKSNLDPEIKFLHLISKRARL